MVQAPELLHCAKFQLRIIVSYFKPAVLFVCVFACAASSNAFAQSYSYVTDDFTVALRSSPSVNADALFALKSGTRVEVIEDTARGSWLKVRTPAGSEGFLMRRHVSEQPIASVRLASVEKELRTAKARVAKLEKRLTEYKDAPAIKAENETLKEQLSSWQSERSSMMANYSQVKLQRRMMLTGVIIFLGGIFAGIVLPMLRRKPRGYGGL